MKFAIALLAALIMALPVRADGWTPANAGGQGESMAIKTLNFAEFDSGRAVLQFDWRDNTGDVIRFRCINNSAKSVRGAVYLYNPANGQTTLEWEGTCQSGQTNTYPTSRFNIAWDTVDGGLILGNYQLAASWPAP